MLFSALSTYFEKLESTPSRNSMVEILAELFKEASASEIDKIAYLLQGRVAPLFEPIEFGMADKMVAKALALAYSIPVEEVTSKFKKSGDIGQVAEELSNKINKVNKSNKVSDVVEKLEAITQTNGEGSVEKKVEILANLLKDSDSLSAKYIARTPVDKLRLGFSDMTILEGLSWMIDGTKKHKDKIEAAYNIRPDLGFIASQVKQVGEVGRVDRVEREEERVFKKIKPKVGTPILVMRAERLTNTAEILDKANGTMAVEPKLDGLRTQLHFSKKGFAGSSNFSLAAAVAVPRAAAIPAELQNSTTLPNRDDKVRLYSRGMENVTSMYPDIVKAAEKELKNVDEVILDGEAIGFDPKTGKYLPFQETVQRKRKHDVVAFSQNVPVKLIVFDVLYLNGKSLIDEPYEKRREILEKLLKNRSFPKNDSSSKIIVPAEMTLVTDAKKMEDLFKLALNSGLEGIMAKRLDGVYQAGARGWNWIKLKGSYTTSSLVDNVDAVVMGLDYGQGKRNKFGVGAFLVGVYDAKTDTYKTLSKIGTGLTDEEWRTLSEKGKSLSVKEKPENYDVNKIMDCDIWLKPSMVGEFRADELTKSPMHTAGYALRFPRLVQWREKKPEDTTSLKEIVEMVKLQM